LDVGRRPRGLRAGVATMLGANFTMTVPLKWLYARKGRLELCPLRRAPPLP